MRKHTVRRVREARINPAIYRQERAAGAISSNEWRATLYGICQSLTDGTFDDARNSQVSDFLGVCFQVSEMTKSREFFDVCMTATNSYLKMLERKRTTGKYGMTGDELSAFRPAVDTLAEAMGALPPTTIKLADAEHLKLLHGVMVGEVRV